MPDPDRPTERMQVPGAGTSRPTHEQDDRTVRFASPAIAPDGRSDDDEREGRRRPRTLWWIVGSVAAALVLIVGGGAVGVLVGQQDAASVAGTAAPVDTPDPTPSVSATPTPSAEPTEPTADPAPTVVPDEPLPMVSSLTWSGGQTVTACAAGTSEGQTGTYVVEWASSVSNNSAELYLAPNPAPYATGLPSNGSLELPLTCGQTTLEFSLVVANGTGQTTTYVQSLTIQPGA